MNEHLSLMNLSGEVENLSGYGYRYTGEQQFYSFYVNLPNGPSAPTKSDPFQGGVNLVLESRSSFLNSTLGSTLNGSHGLPPSITNCFGSSAQITTQNPGSSDFTSIVGSFSADQVTTSCAMTLLGELEPRSANRTNGDPPMGGTYLFLSPVQAELLGLDGQALTLLPFQSPSTSPTGGPPTNDLGSAFGYVVGAFAFAYNALVTAANFIANLPAELKALGQKILGAIEKVLSAVEAAVQWLASALDFLLQIVIAIAKSLVNVALQPVENMFAAWAASVWADLQAAESSGTVTVAEAQAFWTDITGSVFIAGLAIGAIIVIIISIVEGFSLGSGFLLDLVVGMVVGLVVTTALKYAQSAFSSLPSFGSAGVSVVEGYVGTLVSLTTAEKSAFTTIGTVFSDAADFVTAGGALVLVGNYYGNFLAGTSTRNDLYASVIDFALALDVITLDIVGAVAEHQGNTAEAIALLGTADILGAYDVYTDLADPPNPTKEVGGVYTLDKICFYLDIASEGVSLAETVAYF